MSAGERSRNAEEGSFIKKSRAEVTEYEYYNEDHLLAPFFPVHCREGKIAEHSRECPGKAYRCRTSEFLSSGTWHKIHAGRGLTQLPKERQEEREAGSLVMYRYSRGMAMMATITLFRSIESYRFLDLTENACLSLILIDLPQGTLRG